MGRTKPSVIHIYKRVTFTLFEISPVKNYMEEELLTEDLSAKLIDCTGEQFFELFKAYHKNYFNHETFSGVYFYTSHFSSMFLLFNDSFYEAYKEGCYYALPTSFAGLSSFLVKEHYPNDTEYLKTVAYVDRLTTYKAGSFLIEFAF